MSLGITGLMNDKKAASAFLVSGSRRGVLLPWLVGLFDRRAIRAIARAVACGALLALRWAGAGYDCSPVARLALPSAAARLACFFHSAPVWTYRAP
jgi:hypothetical protein